MINKLRFLIGIIVFSLLSAVILFGIFFVGIFLAVAIPFFIVFTGLWGSWAIYREHAKEAKAKR